MMVLVCDCLARIQAAHATISVRFISEAGVLSDAWFIEIFISILGGLLLKVYIWNITKGKARVDH